MAKILLIEDDLTFSHMLQVFLKKHGHEVLFAQDIRNGEKLLAQNQSDLLLLDYRLPDGTGLDLQAKMTEQGLVLPVIIMTSFNDVRTAVNAMRAGAFDYITKPVNPDELLMVIKSALGEKKEDAVLPDKAPAQYVRGNSAYSDRLHAHIDIVAPTDMTVLIQGESGTGKEYVARTIHRQSRRADKNFIAMDCGALSKELAASELFGHVKGAFTGAIADKKGMFEHAEGGTLFMDEIGNLSYEVQVKLLRALQERVIQPLGSNKQISVNVRVIAATNDDLVNSVSEGDFRQDLYHRINEFKIQLSPLRALPEDLPTFIDHFMKQANAELERKVTALSPQARKVLTTYDWPGNLRELKNVIKRMVLLGTGNTAGIETLPEEMVFAVENNLITSESDLKAQNEINEKNLIQKTLQQVKFNKSKAAKLLNIDRKTLYMKIERYGLDS
jgi:two-component system, NtrC family, response regulator HydG